MAYMSQERKAVIAAALKEVVPAGWKYTLAVRDHSTIVMTIKSAPIDLVELATENTNKHRAAEGHDPLPNRGYFDVNHYHLGNQFKGDVLETFEKIVAALNTGNWDKSDTQTDYFNVGWYVDINIGSWNKPFQTVRTFKKAVA